MLEFIIISGLATMGVNKVCSLLVAKKAKDRGYVNKLYNRSQEKKGPVRKTVEFYSRCKYYYFSYCSSWYGVCFNFCQ